jgi:hypothetical protein
MKSYWAYDDYQTGKNTGVTRLDPELVIYHKQRKGSTSGLDKILQTGIKRLKK